jgi:hypothetical protein
MLNTVCIANTFADACAGVTGRTTTLTCLHSKYQCNHDKSLLQTGFNFWRCRGERVLGSIPASRTKLTYATLRGGVFVGRKPMFLLDFPDN